MSEISSYNKRIIISKFIGICLRILENPKLISIPLTGKAWKGKFEKSHRTLCSY